LPDLKSITSMTVTVNGVERPMTKREQWLVSRLIYPLMARSVARDLRKEHPQADRVEIAAIMHADVGDASDPMLLRFIDKVLDRLPPVAGAPLPGILTDAPASPSTWVLLLANLIPVWGVLTQGWEVFPLVLLFWLENVIIGILNVSRMLCVDPGDAGAWVAKLFLVPFFCFHYGMFTMGHGIFVFALFGGETYRHAGLSNLIESAAQAVAGFGLGLPVLGLAGSHLFSFLWNYLLRGEYKVASLQEQMIKPYSRVVTLHIGILGGGFLISMLGSPKWAMLVLLVLKIVFDIRAHLRERRAA